MSDPVLEARRLSMRIDGAVLVDGADLVLYPGEVLGVVGPNGAGKSTLVRMVSGEMEPTAGEVLIDGRPLSSFRPQQLALRRAVLPQHTVLQFAFRALDVVLMGRYPHRESTREHDREVASAVMTDTDTEHLAARTYPTLSGGEQTRVSLARVLAQEAPIIMLDEPTGSLDSESGLEVMSVFQSLNKIGKTIIQVTHDRDKADYSKRIIHIRDGQVEAEEMVGNVRMAPGAGIDLSRSGWGS